jgi:hypothetical protein
VGSFYECLILDIDFQMHSDLPVASLSSIRFYKPPSKSDEQTPAFFSWQYNEFDNDQYKMIADGLIMSDYNKEYMVKLSSIAIKIMKEDNVFTIKYSYHRSDAYKSTLLFHMVLPKNCIMDEKQLNDLEAKEVAVYIRNNRQCVTTIHSQEIVYINRTFTKIDADKFRQISTKPQPLVFNIYSKESKKLFVNPSTSMEN